MKLLRERFRSLYGASPAHLVLVTASFALVAYVGSSLIAHQTIRVVVWFGGAAVVHDLLLLPLYAAANAVLTAIWRRAPRVGSVSWLNYVRFPAAISALSFLVYLPEITRQRTALMRDSGLTTGPYLTHWLLLSAILFGLSAVTFLLRSLQSRSPSNVAASG